jgi:hypothetical protein
VHVQAHARCWSFCYLQCQTQGAPGCFEMFGAYIPGFESIVLQSISRATGRVHVMSHRKLARHVHAARAGAACSLRSGAASHAGHDSAVVVPACTATHQACLAPGKQSRIMAWHGVKGACDYAHTVDHAAKQDPGAPNLTVLTRIGMRRLQVLCPVGGVLHTSCTMLVWCRNPVPISEPARGILRIIASAFALLSWAPGARCAAHHARWRAQPVHSTDSPSTIASLHIHAQQLSAADMCAIAAGAPIAHLASIV